jgi:hypothetical protein
MGTYILPEENELTKVIMSFFLLLPIHFTTSCGLGFIDYN